MVVFCCLSIIFCRFLLLWCCSNIYVDSIHQLCVSLLVDLSAKVVATASCLHNNAQLPTTHQSKHARQTNSKPVGHNSAHTLYSSQQNLDNNSSGDQQHRSGNNNNNTTKYKTPSSGMECTQTTDTVTIGTTDRTNHEQALVMPCVSCVAHPR